MNNCTLIIDGNWLLMSRIGVILSDFQTGQPEEELTAHSENLTNFLARSINNVIRFLEPNIDNILLVSDGGSWRKNIEKPALYNEEYKGNRKKSSDVSWTHVWSALDRLGQKFIENDITYVHEWGVEGDDWCWYWSRYLNRLGVNTIIWSSDCDLKQLVQKDPETLRWTGWYNDKAGFVLPDCYKQVGGNKEDLIDMMMSFEIQDPSVDAIINHMYQHSKDVTYINPDEIVMDKIICGDAGDNIKSVMRVMENGRVKRVSTKEWLVIKENLNITNYDSFLKQAPTIISRLKGLKRFQKSKDSMNDLMDMFNYNAILVKLDKQYIPKEIQQVMNKHKDEYLQADMTYIRNNWRVLGATDEEQDKYITSIFEGIEI